MFHENKSSSRKNGGVLYGLHSKADIAELRTKGVQTRKDIRAKVLFSDIFLFLGLEVEVESRAMNQPDFTCYFLSLLLSLVTCAPSSASMLSQASM